MRDGRLVHSGSREEYKRLCGSVTFNQRICYRKCKIHISALDFSCNSSIVITALSLTALEIFVFVMSLKK